MIVVFSIHCDDACFSVGEWLARNDGVHVVTICGGVHAAATDEDGRWQGTLLAEADKAYTHLEVGHSAIRDIYDGKWIGQRIAVATDVLERQFRYWDRHDVTAYIVPMGIHHPDHVRYAPVLLNLALARTNARVAVYEDLPYRVLYPEEAAILRVALFARFGRNLEPAAGAGFLTKKLEACAMFESQWSPPEGDAPRCCSAYERAWWVR